MTSADESAAGPSAEAWRPPGEGLWYGAAVVLGAVLMVVTARTQPYNQNEWLQMARYGASDLHTIVGGTRQPPLDPLLGSLVQHLVGEGQLRQRLEPVLAGIGSLAVMCLLLRRMRLGLVGVLAAFVLATAPVFVRYTAYVRPYALPTFLMLVVCYAGSRWLEDARSRWLVLAATGALLLPLTRVPEPTLFLTMAGLVLGLLGWRGSLPRRRAWGLAGTVLGALLTIGILELLTLASRTSHVFDTNPVHAVHRVPTGARELVSYVAPLLAHWFPWWPVTVVFLVLAVALPVARRELRGLWFWLPLVLAPLVFLVAYHTLNPYPLDLRHYRARYAYFFAPGFVFLVAAVGRGLADWGARRRIGSRLGAIAVGVLLLSQLPTTYSVVTRADGPDYAEAGDVLRADVPQDAVVLYDSPSFTGRWRVPFFGRPRYLEGAPAPTDVTALSTGGSVHGSGPVYLLVLDSACASSVVCDMPAVRWSGRVPGYRVLRRFSRFTLYEPRQGQQGRQGAARALGQLASAYGVEGNLPDVFAQARVLERLGHRRLAAQVVGRRCARSATPDSARACRDLAVRTGLPVAGTSP